MVPQGRRNIAAMMDVPINQARKGGGCYRHGLKDLNKSPKVQPNANVTPSIPSHQSINYEDEDEDELNSWIWRSSCKTK
jgi:hypothetical protein